MTPKKKKLTIRSADTRGKKKARIVSAPDASGPERSDNSREKIMGFSFIWESSENREFFLNLAIFVAFMGGILFCCEKNVSLGLSLILSCTALFFLKPYLVKMDSVLKFGMVVLGLLMLAEAFSFVPDYATLLPQGLILAHASPGVLFIEGCFLVFAAFAFSPEQTSDQKDIQAGTAWCVLAVMLVFSAFCTFQNLDVPNGYYCDDADAAIEVSMRMNYLDQLPLIGPYSLSETGGHLITALLWRLLPGQSSIHMTYIGAELTALLNIWLMYLLGREVMNRRTGLIFAALGTACKWIPAEVISCYFPISATLGVTWSLLAFFRLLKKPDWTRFIHWVLAVSYGAYTYPAFRLFGFFMIFALLFWAIFTRRFWKSDGNGVALGGCLGLFWASNFLMVNGFAGPLLSHFLVSPWLLAPATCVFGVILFLVLRDKFKHGLNEIFVKMFFSFGFILFLTAPMIYNKDYGARFSILNPVSHDGNLIVSLLHRIGLTFQACFMDGGSWDASAFDFQAAWVISLGLLVFLAKPNWVSLFIFAAVWVGLANHFIPEYSYNGRMAVAVTPLFLLAAMGLERLFVWGSGIWRQRDWALFFAVVLSSFFVWEACTSYQDVYHRQIYFKGIEALVGRQIAQDSPGNRVYLSLFPDCSSPECQGILDEGHPFYVLHEQNPIYLRPGDVSPDIVVIVFAGDEKLKQALTKAFPVAQWTGINFNTFHYPTVSRDDTAPRFFRVLIPAAAIGKSTGKIFFTVQAAPNDWKRDFFWPSYRPGYGAVNYEDETSSLQAPFPLKDEVSTASFDGVFVAPVDGNYYFSVTAANFVILKIDQKEIMSNVAYGNGSFSGQGWETLKKGIHSVRYVVYFRNGQDLPQVKIRMPGSESLLDLDYFSRE